MEKFLQEKMVVTTNQEVSSLNPAPKSEISFNEYLDNILKGKNVGNLNVHHKKIKLGKKRQLIRAELKRICEEHSYYQ